MIDLTPDVETGGWKVPAQVTLLGIVFVAIFAWRLTLGASGPRFEESGVLLALAALLAAIAALLAARGRIDANGRPWFLIAVASLAWGASHPAQLSDDRTATLAFNAGFALFVALVAGGVVSFGARAVDRDSWRKLIFDLISPVVALLVVTWLVLVGPYVLSGGASRQMRSTAMIHGVGVVVLLVLGIAGLFSRRGGALGSPPRMLLAGVGSIALGDGLWLQRWIDGASRINLLAELVFAAGFLLIACSALRRRNLADPADAIVADGIAAPSGWESHLPNAALMLLLMAALAQALLGDAIVHGVEIAILGGMAVIGLGMMRQSLSVRRERRLHRHIDQLSEQIDGLISQVGRDPLTGLLNHRAVHERLERELVHGRSFGHPVSTVLIDVDNFKTVNDSLGHQTGDLVLHAVASILTAACRGTDVAARYAGDEFMLILPGLDEEHVAAVCGRIVNEVRRVNSSLDLGPDIQVTLSVGVAVSYTCRRNVKQIVAIADAAMYDAKEGGKDDLRVVDADTLITVDPRRDAGLSGRPERRSTGPAHRYEVRERRRPFRRINKAS